MKARRNSQEQEQQRSRCSRPCQPLSNSQKKKEQTLRSHQDHSRPTKTVFYRCQIKLPRRPGLRDLYHERAQSDSVLRLAIHGLGSGACDAPPEFQRA